MYCLHYFCKSMFVFLRLVIRFPNACVLSLCGCVCVFMFQCKSEINLLFNFHIEINVALAHNYYYCSENMLNVRKLFIFYVKVDQ